MLVGDPSQTKDASAINLAENNSVCLQIAQRFGTVATHHKLTCKPAGMFRELWDLVQIVILPSTKMSLEEIWDNSNLSSKIRLANGRFSKSYISFNTGAVGKAQSHPNPNSKPPPIPVLSQNAKNIDRCKSQGKPQLTKLASSIAQPFLIFVWTTLAGEIFFSYRQFSITAPESSKHIVNPPLNPNLRQR